MLQVHVFATYGARMAMGQPGRNHAASDPIWHGEMSAIQNLSDSLAGSGKSV
jgi:tRNA(Arg) A34 adenosine deaminase TadA